MTNLLAHLGEFARDNKHGTTVAFIPSTGEIWEGETDLIFRLADEEYGNVDVLTLTVDGGSIQADPFTKFAVAVGWLLRLRQLQGQGHTFDTALAIANDEYPNG